MIYPIIILISSFLIDGIASHYVDVSYSNISIFTTIYTVIALCLTHRYFQNKRKYYLLCIIFGLLFDIVYTGTFILNMTVFLILGLIINKLYNVLTTNIINNIIISVIIISIYYILTNVILLISGYLKFNIILLIKIIVSSLLMTIIYSLILSIINNYITKHKDIK